MSKKEIITSKCTGDSCIHVKHKSGLDIISVKCPVSAPSMPFSAQNTAL